MTLTDVQTTVTLDRLSADGQVLATLTLDPSIFALPVNVPLIHQVVTAQLAARRSGTQSTKTRAEVKGGAAKPFRQKGTGNARQGTIRAPHYTGGGIALGPKPRGYAQKTPKKMVQQALRCALSDRAREGGLRLVDSFGFTVPKTKDGVKVLDAIGATGRVLVVLSREDEVAGRSFANLPHVVTLPADQLTAFDVLSADVIVFTDDTIPGENTEQAGAAPKKAAARTRTAKATAAATTEAPAAEAVEAPPVAEEPATADEPVASVEEPAEAAAEEGDAE